MQVLFLCIVCGDWSFFMYVSDAAIHTVIFSYYTETLHVQTHTQDIIATASMLHM